MKLTVSTVEPIMVIDKSKKPWNMDGRSGVTYTAVCHKKVDEEVQVEKIRITEDVYNFIEETTRYNFEGTVDITNSGCRLTFTSVLPDDVYPPKAGSTGNASATGSSSDTGKKSK